MEAKHRTNRFVIVFVSLIVISLATSGFWYYFFVYTPQYQSERTRLLTLRVTADPAHLDPALAYDTDSDRIVVNIFDRLVRFKQGTTDIEPSLATSWETPDSTTYLFDLRTDVRFHDGTSFNASCVKYSLDRVINSTSNSSYSYLFAVINSTEVLANYRIKISLNYQFTPFLSIMAHPAASIVSPTAVERLEDNFDKNPVGTGPFKFVSWTLNKEVVLDSNKNYFMGAPSLEGVVFESVLEAAARKTALEKGEIDAVSGGILETDVPDLRKNSDIKVYQGNSSSTEFLVFNMQKAPLSDIRVRQAIAYSIDYDTIINQTYGGGATRLSGPVPPTIFGYANLPLIQRNITKARELLAEAGYSKGFDITLTYNIESVDRRKTAEIIRNNLADVGINIKIQGLDWPSAMNEYLAMGHQLALEGWTPDYYDPDSYLTPQFHSSSLAPNGANIFGLNDTEIDSLIVEGSRTSNQTARLLIYKGVQEKIMDKMPCTFIAVPSIQDCVRYNVMNWVCSPTEMPEYFYVYKK